MYWRVVIICTLAILSRGYQTFNLKNRFDFLCIRYEGSFTDLQIRIVRLGMYWLVDYMRFASYVKSFLATQP